MDGVSETELAMEEWLHSRRVTEIECMVPDMAGVARGKILPTEKFLKSFHGRSLRLPESIFLQTVTGDIIDSEILDDTEPDLTLRPDPTSLRIVPWYEEPTGQVICDPYDRGGTESTIAPRSVLRRVLALYEERGWRPIMAPELEFYLSKKNIDPDYPLEPPIGRSGRPETGRQAYGIDAVNEFDPIFEDMYDFCEAQELDVDTLIHESGAAQVEINFVHGEPMSLADQVFMFKRTVRQAAIRHDVYATFMAKPYEREPGSAMHIHVSVVDAESGQSLFGASDGSDTDQFHHFIGGQQRYMAQAMPLLGPNVNSYRRLVKHLSAPINTHWGYENRTVGLRVPDSPPQARRIENRIPGADANPYLAMAAVLACGYLGMVEEIEPSAPIERNAYELKSRTLPRHILDAIGNFSRSSQMKEVLGETFVSVYSEVKLAEHEAYQQVISAWEREHLLLNV